MLIQTLTILDSVQSDSFLTDYIINEISCEMIKRDRLGAFKFNECTSFALYIFVEKKDLYRIELYQSDDDCLPYLEDYADEDIIFHKIGDLDYIEEVIRQDFIQKFLKSNFLVLAELLANPDISGEDIIQAKPTLPISLSSVEKQIILSDKPPQAQAQISLKLWNDYEVKLNLTSRFMADLKELIYQDLVKIFLLSEYKK